MGKIPNSPEEIFDELKQDYTALFGDDLVAIILYGSGARGEYVPKKSDINLLIVLSENGIERLGDATDAAAKWRKRNVRTPLVMTKGYIKSSLDAFPLEFFNIKSAYQVVYGEDVLKDVVIRKEDLRLQCERELKAKLLLLRESFLEANNKKHLLRELVAQSLSAFISIFKALLYLKGDEVPEKNVAVLSATVQSFGLDVNLFQNLWRIKRGEKKPGKDELEEIVQKYISEIRGLSTQVDQMDL
ncbi:MAG: nucleotidyltransferase domain-containing protein [Deltaproteobacteria bacterium]|nr:MAG: nucleotidyltransferase domain-containing protein [Deltaproteobacteria bacterium]